MLEERTPVWVLVGVVMLSCISGWVNAVGLLGVLHEALTHVTGTVTQAAIAFGRGDVRGAARTAVVVVAFFVGAVLSGLIIGSPELKRGRHYGAGLLVEAALLSVAWGCFTFGVGGGDAAASSAAGLQNGLLTTWSGAILRTTHLTGVVTDLGVGLGYLLRGQRVTRRFALQLGIVGGFFFGGVLGSESWLRFGADALLGPIALCVLAAWVYVASLPRTGEAAPPSSGSPVEQAACLVEGTL